ncbi:MAG: PEP-CTERM sorting domain-containing protein [Limisphaerales bacterium]
MRVFETAAGSYEAAASSPSFTFGFGQSGDVFVPQLGGITPPGASVPIVPTPDLAGLQGFVIFIPEPSTIALVILGAAALFHRHRTRSLTHESSL